MPEAKTKWTPDPEQRELLQSLKAEQDKFPSAAKFVAAHLPFGEAKWSRIISVLEPANKESYFDMVEEPDGVIEQLTLILRELRTEQVREKVDIIKLPCLRAVVQSIRECKGVTSPERITKYIAQPGGGKSMICQYLRTELSATVVEVRPSWKTSSFITWKDICKALKVRIGSENDPSVIEDTVVEYACKRSIILAMDEGEYFGACSLDILKRLLNRTPMRLFIAAIGQAHDKWNYYFPMQAEQISRRTHATIELLNISPKDAGLFFPQGQFKDEDEALGLIASDAFTFGAFSLIRRVGAELKGLERVGNDEVAKAIASARKQMLRGGMMPQVTNFRRAN
ncbi:MAG: hypothetical protein JWR69_3044 [Pedosphaera sp.]|nr:hypothetical protein [Pedosphaera sp.]